MKTNQRSLARALGLSVCTLGLAACGGGGGAGGSSAGMPSTSPQASDSVPAAASSSVTALVTWASQLPQSEVAQPLSTASFTPPVSETTEPMPLMI